MKILITSHRFHPDIGGIETITAILANSFCVAGHSVCVVTQSIGRPVEDINFPFQVLRRPSALKLLAGYRWADVVLQNNLEIRQLWPLLLGRKPLVIGLQTWIRTVDGKRGLIQKVKRSVLDAADQLIACSNAVRIDCHPRAKVVGNPYNSALFRILPHCSRRKAIAFLGRLVSDKGADMLLRAFASLAAPDWKLSLIGEGPERSSLEILASELDIAPRVVFFGPLQGEALVRALNQHEILAVPSRWQEPFGVVVLEGLACGCVVLASDGGGLPDAVGQAGLLFRRGDQVSLNCMLAQLVMQSELRHQLRARAASQLQAFEQEVICHQYMSVLEQAVASVEQTQAAES